MSELISGKEALSVVSDGVVQYRCADSSNPELWTTITDHYWGQYDLGVFLDEDTTWEFRLKPKTININGIEIEKPKDIVIDSVTGSVGLVYGDIEQSKKVAKELRGIFNVI